jgi:hypothetical protein
MYLLPFGHTLFIEISRANGATKLLLVILMKEERERERERETG